MPVVHIDNRWQFPNIFFIYFSRILDRWGCIIFNSTPFSHLCLWTGPEEHKYAKHVSIVNWVGVEGGAYSIASPENLPNTLQKIRETLKSAQAIFNVFSRYRSIPGEHMWKLQNGKYHSGRTHPDIDKIKQCVRPLSTRLRANITRYLYTLEMW
jgi:hypothetical protein